MSVVAGSQLQPPQVSELCLVTSTRSSLPAHFCSVAGQLFPVTSFERFLVAYVSNLLPNSARLYSTANLLHLLQIRKKGLSKVQNFASEIDIKNKIQFLCLLFIIILSCFFVDISDFVK